MNETRFFCPNFDCHIFQHSVLFLVHSLTGKKSVRLFPHRKKWFTCSLSMIQFFFSSFFHFEKYARMNTTHLTSSSSVRQMSLLQIASTVAISTLIIRITWILSQSQSIYLLIHCMDKVQRMSPFDTNHQQNTCPFCVFCPKCSHDTCHTCVRCAHLIHFHSMLPIHLCRVEMPKP